MSQSVDPRSDAVKGFADGAADRDHFRDLLFDVEREEMLDTAPEIDEATADRAITAAVRCRPPGRLGLA